MNLNAHSPHTPGVHTPGFTQASIRPAPSPLRFLRLPEVMARTALSRTGIYRRIAAGTFPRQVTLGEKSVAWIEAEVEAWMLDRVADSQGSRRQV